MEQAYNFAKENRALGLGSLGWHSLLQSKMLSFNSQEAFDLNSEISGRLSFATDNKTLSSALLKLTFEEMTQNIRVENLRAISDLKRSIQTSLDFEINEIEQKIENAVQDHEVATRAQLALLAEQAAIARQLKIADNQVGLANQGQSGIGISVNNENPLYLRGYKALEKEAALIKARGKGNAILPYSRDRYDKVILAQRLEPYDCKEVSMEDAEAAVIAAWNSSDGTIHWTEAI